MNVQNRTEGKHLAVPMKDVDGRPTIAVIVKYTFRATPSGRLELDEDGAEPRPIDVAYGEDPAKSSIRYPSDLFDRKPGTDVVLLGRAYARAGATSTDVTLRVGTVDKTVRAYGLRAWQRGTFGGVKPGPALPIREPVPLVYELAWGGLDLSDPNKPVAEPRNHVGRGIARDPAKLVDQPASQLELGGKSDVPASFGAIHRHWQPRAAFAGTYDDAWQKTRMPLLPRDFDPRFNVCVPHDQWIVAPLRGGEPVLVLGATEDGQWRFDLPSVAVAFTSLIRGERRTHATHLDTVLVDAERRSIELTWRAVVPAPDKLEHIDEIRIREDGRS